MVEVIPSGGSIIFDDTFFVSSEFIGIDSDGNRLFSNSISELITTFVFQKNSSGNHGISGILLAFLFSAFIGIIFVRGDSVFDDPVESGPGETALTSVFNSTVDELLFRKTFTTPAKLFFVLQVVDSLQTFDSASGRESPARSASTLVFNRNNHSFVFSPVSFFRSVSLSEPGTVFNFIILEKSRLFLTRFVLVALEASVLSNNFGQSQISEIVELKLVGRS